MNATMTAIRLHEFGGPDVLELETAAVPDLAEGEVLVQVRAAALNPPDWYAREGMPGVPESIRPDLELPMIPGTDVSGVVVAVADDVTDFAVGDEVAAMARFPDPMQAGAYAEYTAVPATDLAVKPTQVEHAHAAALAMSGLTAWQFLVEVGHDVPSPFQEAKHVPAPMGPGTTVVVNGAAGGVGHLAVQLAKWRGARVIAIASGSHEAFLRDLGADEFIDYTKQDPTTLLEDVDVVFDTVGGPHSRRFLRSIRRGGSLYPAYMAEFDEDETAALGITVTAIQVRADGRQLAELLRLVTTGDLSVAIDSRYPLAEAAAAHERAARGHLRGKIVLDVA